MHCPDSIEAPRGEAVYSGLAASEQAPEDAARLQAQLLASIRQAIIVSDPDSRVISWNKHAEIIYGWSADEAIGKNVTALIFPDGKLDRSAINSLSALRKGKTVERERQACRKDGTLIWVSINASPVFDVNGQLTHFIRASFDITERVLLEKQITQQQKMEAVGRLAGGIAHDFNNLLTVIRGHAEFLSESLPETGESRQDIDQISESAARASNLIRQLLAFSRQQVLEQQVINANVLIGGLENRVARVAGEKIQMSRNLHPGTPAMLGDRVQIEQAVMNLVLNACEAMPDGGRLELSTRVLSLSIAEAKARSEARAGDYVAIGVSDSGRGIDSESLVKVFEPFFTTKKQGKGTGLGLATVYGIAQQSGGFVDVESLPGKGSTFTLCLPAATADVRPAKRPTLPGSAAGNGRVLLVEDQEEVRNVARRILVASGYRVVEAENGVEALAVIDADRDGIDLVLTDAVMPNMGGPDLVRALRTTLPTLPVIITSGYSDHELVTHCTNELNVPFLAKPFRAEDLLNIVRGELDASQGRKTSNQPGVAEPAPPAGAVFSDDAARSIVIDV